MHGKQVFFWSDGNPTATAPKYDSTERQAKAARTKVKAGGSRRRNVQFEPEPELDIEPEPELDVEPEPKFDIDEDGEYEVVEDGELIGELEGSRSPPVPTPAEEEEDGDVYIVEVQSSPPVLQQAGGSQSPAQRAASPTNVPEGPQPARGLAPCWPSRSALEDALAHRRPPKEPSVEERIETWKQTGELSSLFPTEQPSEKHVAPLEGITPAPCVGAKRALEEADMPSPKTSSPAPILADIPSDREAQPTTTFGRFYRQVVEENLRLPPDFAMLVGARSRQIGHVAFWASISNSFVSQRLQRLIALVINVPRESDRSKYPAQEAHHDS